MNNTLHTQHLSGAAIAPYLLDLARLRITVFREFPYLYDGSAEYEMRYLQTYVNSPDSIAVLVLDGETVVGASTGLPMAHEEAAFQQPFLQQGYDPNTLFYCAESVLLPEYRGRGIYKTFFAGRENHARQLDSITHLTFCGVQRPADHPLRPTDYVALDAVWRKFGYIPQPALRTTYAWKDINEAEASPKPMQFWMKALGWQANSAS
jgi:GNAT superfamily N-acetyltransferase